MDREFKKGIDYTGVSVTFLCHDGNGKFVLAKRSNNARDEHNKWENGGGGLEFGHTVEETLRKEIKKEYCADVLDYEFLGYMDALREYEEKQTHWITLNFKVRVDPREVGIGEPDMIDEIGWFTLDTVPPIEELHSQLPQFFELYKDKLKEF